ncbi:hypothetical protein, partial [Enterocloster asparagiformis]|uniref:hypothetical protein n=1 Tax=Enterocloster asparagiformis TaxID=333367 RepID=UPI00068885EC
MQDMEYLMSMYPSGVKKLQRYVSEACDRMEYKNSPMYDEFPDHIVVNQMCDSICDTVISEEGLAQIQSFWSMAEKDRSDVEGLELKQEMSRLEAISTLPEHYTDDAKNSQSAKADTDYIEKTGENSEELMAAERRPGGEDEEQFQTQELCWDQPMSGTPWQMQQNPANIGAVNATDGNFVRAAAGGTMGQMMGMMQPAQGMPVGPGGTMPGMPPEMNMGRQYQTMTQPANNDGNAKKVWDSGSAQRIPGGPAAGMNAGWNAGMPQPMQARLGSSSGPEWSTGPVQQTPSNPNNLNNSTNRINSPWPVQGPMGMGGNPNQGIPAQMPQGMEQYPGVMFQGNMNPANSGAFPQGLAGIGNGQNSAMPFQPQMGQENKVYSPNPTVSQNLGQIYNGGNMGRMPINSNIGLGPELLSQSSIGQEKPVSEIDKKMELVENSVSGSTMDERDRLSRVPDNGNSSGAEEGFGRNRDRVAVEQVREEDISDLDSNAALRPPTVAGVELSAMERMDVNYRGNSERMRVNMGPGPVRPPQPGRPEPP